MFFFWKSVKAYSHTDTDYRTGKKETWMVGGVALNKNGMKGFAG